MVNYFNGLKATIEGNPSLAVKNFNSVATSLPQLFKNEEASGKISPKKNRYVLDY